MLILIIILIIIFTKTPNLTLSLKYKKRPTPPHLLTLLCYSFKKGADFLLACCVFSCNSYCGCLAIFSALLFCPSFNLRILLSTSGVGMMQGLLLDCFYGVVTCAFELWSCHLFWLNRGLFYTDLASLHWVVASPTLFWLLFIGPWPLLTDLAAIHWAVVYLAQVCLPSFGRDL